MVIMNCPAVYCVIYFYQKCEKAGASSRSDLRGDAFHSNLFGVAVKRLLVFPSQSIPIIEKQCSWLYGSFHFLDNDRIPACRILF